VFRPFTFKREAQWLLVIALLAPLIGIVMALLAPWPHRHGWW
jgi:hypothetical protein